MQSLIYIRKGRRYRNSLLYERIFVVNHYNKQLKRKPNFSSAVMSSVGAAKPHMAIEYLKYG
jgi:hypothetical protein